MTDCKTISELLGASRSRSVPLGANWPQATSQERLGASHTNKKASRRGGGGVGARCTERAVRSIWDAQTRQASEEEEEEEEEESGLDAQSMQFRAYGTHKATFSLDKTNTFRMVESSPIFRED